MKLRTAFVALAAALVATGCPTGQVGDVLVVAEVDVTPGIQNVVMGQTLSLTAQPKTSSGIAVTGRIVSWSSSDQTIATVSTSGVVTGVAVGGPVRIRATVDGITGDAVITVHPVPVDHVTVDPQVAGVLVGGSVVFTANAHDANNGLLSGRSFFWNSSDNNIAAITTTGTAIGLTEGGPVTISATAEGKTGTASVSVATRPAKQLEFKQQPGLTYAGLAMSPPISVALEDDRGITVIGAINPVTIVLAGHPEGATLSGLTTATPANGVASFSNLILNRVGAYTFLVTSPGLQSQTSTPFDVIAGLASQPSFATPPPSGAQSGAPFSPQPAIQLRDGSGNPVAQSGVVITASIASGGGNPGPTPAGPEAAAALGGNTTATTNASGLATFTNLSISGTAGSYTLSFSAPGMTTLVSGIITLSAGTAAVLFVATQPSSAAQSNTPIPQQPAIQLRDAAGNNVAQGGVVVTASLASGSGSLTGVLTATSNASGLASFTSLAISGPSGTYTLGFSAAGLTSATSGPIVLGAGGATQIAMVTQSSAAASSGVALSQQPSVRLRDASNNSVALAGVSVSASVSVGGTLAGTATQLTDASGIATFTDLAISGLAGPYTLTFSSSGLASATSNSIALSAGAATKLAITTAPSPAAASGVAFATQPVIQIQDASGNPVSRSGTTISVTLASGPGGGSLGGTTTATTNAGGTASFTNLAISGPSGTYTLQFTASGLASVTSGGITLGAGAATKLAISTQPSSSAQSGVTFAQQPVIQLRDAADNPVAQGGVVITAAIASGGGSLGGTITATTNAGGTATFTNLAISGTIGNRTLSFTSGSLTGATSGTITITAGVATQLGISTQPSSSAQSGVAFGQQPVIQLRDASNNAVSQSGVVVAATIASGGGTLGGTTTATTNASGAATFTNLSITGTAGDRTLSFTAGGLTPVTSGTITVTAGAASQLIITTQPSSAAQSGVAFGQQPVIQLRDASNNPVAQAGVVVTAAISSGGGALGGTTTASTNASGVATFSNLSISGIAGDRTLLFSASGFTSITSGTITISAGATSQLTITTQPSSSAQSGVAFGQQPVIQLRDGAGNAVSQSGVVVTAGIVTGGGALGGTTTATTNASGVVTFTNLQISGTIGDRTLSFSASGLSGATSGTVTLTAGPASQLTISTQPSSSAQSGVAFAQQPVVQLRDASNNAVSQSGVVVTAAIASGGGTLGGTTTPTTNASGVASFTNLMITGTAGDRTFSFSAAGVTSTTSGTVTVTAGAASQLGITTQPSSSAQSGVVFAQQPVIQLRDASNNPVSQAGVVVTAAINSGGGALGGTTTATTNASGVAAFTNLMITGTIGDHTLLFSAPGYTSGTSGTITITAGTATQLSITTQPSSSAQSGVAFAQQPVIQLRDGSGNAVSQSGVVVTAAIASGGGALGGTATATTNASGVATFTNLQITGTIGDRTVSFSATGLTTATSGTVTLTAGPASQLTITTQPSSSAQSGVAFPQQPVIQLRDASSNAVSQSGVVVTAAIASGGGTLGGTATATTNASGVASFANLQISGTTGARTLSFTSGSLTSATSGTITLTAGPASQLTITTQPSSSAQSGVAFAQQPVLQLRDASNNAVSQSGVSVTAAIATGGGTLGSTASVNTNASGVATFTNLMITGTAGDRTLSFSATGLTGATSGTVTVTAGAASQLSITTQPSGSAQSGVAFAQQPVIQLRDASNNPVSQSGVVVTASISTGGGSLGGTATATTNASGVATFTNLSISGTIGDRTLLFSATGYTSVTSGTITITAGAATQLSITTQPSSSAQSGVAFPQQPVIQLRDASSNAVSQSGVIVTAAIATGGGSLGGTATATTNASGVATFTNLSISGTIGNRTLSFSATGLTSATSGTITLTAGPASQLTLTTQPSSSAQSGAAFAQQPVLQLRDASNNTVSQSGVAVTAGIASGPGGATLGGSTVVTTDASGVASYTNLSLSGTAGNYTLSFSGSGLTSATSNTIGLTAGAGTKLGITTQPSASVQNTVAFPQHPVIQLLDAANNPVSQSGVLVTTSIQSGGGTLGGTLSVSTNASGVATFTNLAITGTTGNRTLLFAAAGYVSVASNAVNVTAGPADHLLITTQPSSSAQSAVAFAQQPVLQLQDASNNNVSQSGVNVTAAIASGGGTLGGTLIVATSASGVATYTNLKITGTIGDRTVSFSGTGLTGATSGTITLSAGAANTIVANSTTSQSATVGTAVSAPPSAKVTDASGNPKSGVTVTFTVTQDGGGGTTNPASPAAINTDANGIATLTSWTLGNSVGTDNNRVEATASVPNGSPVIFNASGLAPLGAPTLSLTSTSATSVQLGGTAASGGTGSYTYKWHRATIAGFTPSAANLLAAPSSVSLTDNGASAGVPYWYSLEVNDGHSSAYSNQVLGAVTPATTPASLPSESGAVFLAYIGSSTWAINQGSGTVPSQIHNNLTTSFPSATLSTFSGAVTGSGTSDYLPGQPNSNSVKAAVQAASGFKILRLMIGSNDAAADRTVATWQANMQTIINDALTWPVDRIVLEEIGIRLDGGNALLNRIVEYNAARSNLLGAKVVLGTAYTFENQGTHLSTLSGDNIHQTDAGHVALAGEQALEMQALFSSPDDLVSADLGHLEGFKARIVTLDRLPTILDPAVSDQRFDAGLPSRSRATALAGLR